MADFDPDVFIKEKKEMLGNEQQPFDPDVFMNEMRGYPLSANDDNKPGMLESYVRGIGDFPGGSTKFVGAAHSPKGAGKALLELLGADYTGDADVAKYEKAKHASEKDSENAQKTNPGSYFLGQGTAGVGAALLLKRLGFPGGAATGSTAEKLGNAAAMSGSYGLLHGFLDSRKDTLPEKAQDAAIEGGVSALVGPVVHAGMGVVGNEAKAMWKAAGVQDKLVNARLTDILKDTFKGANSPSEELRYWLGEVLSHGWDLGKQGLNLMGQKGRNAFTASTAKDWANQTYDSFKKVSETLGKHKNIILNQHFNQPFDQNNKLIRAIQTRLNNMDVDNKYVDASRRELQSLLNGYLYDPPLVPGGPPIRKQLTFGMANKLKKSFSLESGFESSHITTPEGRAVAKAIAGDIRAEIGRVVPGMAESNKLFQNFYQKVLKPAGLDKRFYQSQNEVGAKKTLAQKLYPLDAPTTTGSQTTIAKDIIMEGLKSIDPQMAKNFEKSIKAASLNIQTAKAGHNNSVSAGLKPMTMLKSAGVIGTNAAGLMANTLSKIPKNSLLSAGTHLSKNKNALVQSIGKAFVMAADRDDVGKNALIFTLMQNEAYRKALSDMFTEQPEIKETKRNILP